MKQAKYAHACITRQTRYLFWGSPYASLTLHARFLCATSEKSSQSGRNKCTKRTKKCERKSELHSYWRIEDGTTTWLFGTNRLCGSNCQSFNLPVIYRHLTPLKHPLCRYSTALNCILLSCAILYCVVFYRVVFY